MGAARSSSHHGEWDGATGVRLEVIEKCLNHISGSFGGIVGVYQRHSFAEEKRAAFEAWARHVEGVVSKTPSNVVPMVRRRGSIR